MKNYNLLWQTLNQSIVPHQVYRFDSTDGQFQVGLPVSYDSLSTNNPNVFGYLVGKDPVHHPYWMQIPNKPQPVESVLKSGLFRFSIFNNNRYYYYYYY